MDAKELKEAQDNLKKKSQAKKAVSNKVADLLTAGKRIGSKPLKHTIAGFEFETVSVLSKKQRQVFADAVSNMNKSNTPVEDVLNACATLMSEVCIDDELKDPKVWLEFNDASGSLVDVVQHMLGELVISHEEMKTFR